MRLRLICRERVGIPTVIRQSEKGKENAEKEGRRSPRDAVLYRQEAQPLTREQRCIK